MQSWINIISISFINRIQIEDLQTLTVDNTIACEAIAEKLMEISKTAESLDNILSAIQEDVDVLETSDAISPTLFVPSGSKSSSANNSDVSVILYCILA